MATTRLLPLSTRSSDSGASTLLGTQISVLRSASCSTAWILSCRSIKFLLFPPLRFLLLASTLPPWRECWLRLIRQGSNHSFTQWALHRYLSRRRSSNHCRSTWHSRESRWSFGPTWCLASGIDPLSPCSPESPAVGQTSVYFQSLPLLQGSCVESDQKSRLIDSAWRPWTCRQALRCGPWISPHTQSRTLHFCTLCSQTLTTYPCSFHAETDRT